jgi:GT2 family glycosyltransferase
MINDGQWEVRHLDVSQPLADLRGIRHLRLYFWWRGLLLGHGIIPKERLPLKVVDLTKVILDTITPVVRDYWLAQDVVTDGSALSSQSSRSLDGDWLDLVKLSHPLSTLWQRLNEKPARFSVGDVSLVVCTRDRPESLRRCLDSLQWLRPSPKEVVVVDNAPSNDASQQLVRQYPGIRYIKESIPGLCAARNAGIHHTSGAVVAFTDDDTEANPDWLLWVARGFANSQVMAVTGQVLPAELETRAQLIFQESGCGFGWGYVPRTFDGTFWENHQKSGVPVWTIGAGANMAFRREVFESVGFFDERLGPGASGCSGDSEMWYRILAGGWHCRYEPAAVVHHFHRAELKELRSQMFYYMRGHVSALLIQFQWSGHWGNLRRAFVLLPKYYLKCLLNFHSRNSRAERFTIVSQLFGCLAGVFYFARYGLREATPKHNVKAVDNG